MKNKSWIACLLLLFGMTTGVFAMYMELTSPSLAFTTEVPVATQTKIFEVLQRTDYKFVSGDSLNSSTTLRYGGDTKALNLFLGELVKIPGVVLNIQFKPDDLGVDCDWVVRHLGYTPYRFDVSVNPKSAHIKLEDLVIPEINGPSLPPGK